MKMSYSKMTTYKDCPAKYKFQYVDKYRQDATSSAFLFGLAFDQAVNYILNKHKKGQTPDLKHAKKAFLKGMKLWHGQNELIYFKADLPDALRTMDAKVNQQLAWNHLCMLGQMMVEEYVTKILPHIKRVVLVQKRKIVKNGAQDELNFVLDCIVELQDGRVVLFDTKTSSKQYARNSVRFSEQLAMYNEYYPTEWCGYIVFNKHLKKDGTLKWQIIVDKIDEQQKATVFKDMDDTVTSIKAGLFPKNKKSCYNFGRRCEYFNLCHKGDPSGLIKKP